MFSMVRQYTAVLLLRALSASGGVLFPVYLGIQGSEALLGHYAVAYTLVVGLAVLMRGGLDSGFVRVLSNQKYQLAKKVAWAAVCKRRIYLLLLPLLSIVAVSIISRSGSGDTTLNYALMMLSSGLVSCITIYCALLKATGHPRLSCLFEFGFISLVALIFQIVLDGFELTEDRFGLSFLLAVLVLSFVVYRSLAVASHESFSEEQQVRELMGDLQSSSGAFLKMNAFNYLQQFSAVVVSGLVVSPSTIGAFKLVERFGSLAGFPLMAINSLFGHHYAKATNPAVLTRTYTRACLLGGAIAVPIFLTLYFLLGYAGWQSLAWADDYLMEFSVLGLAYVLTSVFGSSGVLLNATGLHGYQLKIMVYTGILSVPAFYVMTHWLGLMGMVLTMALLLVGQAILPLLGYFRQRGSVKNA